MVSMVPFSIIDDYKLAPYDTLTITYNTKSVCFEMINDDLFTIENTNLFLTRKQTEQIIFDFLVVHE